MSQSARDFHESVTKQAAALSRLRLGLSIADFEWRRTFPGSRIAPVVDKLRNAHGFDIRGDGSADDKYYLDKPNQEVGRIEVTDAIKAGYYLTGHWEAMRSERMAQDEYQCVLCGDTDGLQVHHIVYKLFEEKLRHLMTVCEVCHDELDRDSRLKFPSGVTVEHAKWIGVEYTIPEWLKPKKAGLLF